MQSNTKPYSNLQTHLLLNIATIIGIQLPCNSIRSQTQIFFQIMHKTGTVKPQSSIKSKVSRGTQSQTCGVHSLDPGSWPLEPRRKPERPINPINQKIPTISSPSPVLLYSFLNRSLVWPLLKKGVQPKKKVGVPVLDIFRCNPPNQRFEKSNCRH